MKAVLYTGGRQVWSEALGDRPWALLPVAGRPLLSYWLELCVELGIYDVQIILGKNAEFIEQFCGSGEQWGLSINYSFILPEDDPRTYLARDAHRWSEGLFYVAGGTFPRRAKHFSAEKMSSLLDGCCVCGDYKPSVFISRNRENILHFIRQDPCPQKCETRLEDAGIDFTLISDISHYYQLNMEVVRNEMSRYLSSGYSFGEENASIGYNVITPPSVALTPPLAIGNDCRIGALSVIGPGAVVSDHVLIDRQCELSDCIILSDTYLGRNLEINGKIVAGNRIIDPEDGTWLDIEDPWLVAPTRSRNYFRDFFRAVLGWEIALLLVIVQLIPFIFLYAIIWLLGHGRFENRSIWGLNGSRVQVAQFEMGRRTPGFLAMFFCSLSLDRFPQLLSVLAGKLWLCGQVPEKATEEGPRDAKGYFPAVFSYSDAFADIDRQMDALYYAHTRSSISDLRILRHALFSRLVVAGVTEEVES